MPQYKKRGKRPRYRNANWKPRLKRHRKPDAFDYARTAYTGVKALYRFVNTETKAHDVAVSRTPTNGGEDLNLAVIPLGDNYDDRDGISIKPLRLHTKLTIEKHPTPTTQQVRVLVVRGKNENGTNVVNNDVFASTGVNQFKVWDKRFKTKTLMDYTVTMDSSSKQIYNINKSLTLSGHITYDIGTTSGLTYENGGLYMFIWSDTATNLPTVFVNTRLEYVDN